MNQAQSSTSNCWISRTPRFAAVVVNFNTSSLTIRCVASLVVVPAVRKVIVVDNHSSREQIDELRRGLARFESRVVFLPNATNLGFAGASNQGITIALEDAEVTHVLLLNSDAEATDDMSDWLNDLEGDLCAARVMSTGTGEVDSTGIVMYASALASNRTNDTEPLFGPTGGCAVYSRRLIEDLISSHGYCFDVDFFCYAEDTDVAARAILLGYHPVYDGRAVAVHVGQASTGSKFNDFILYHGIRNSIWTVLKSFPACAVLRRAHKIFALHFGIVFMHTLQGRGRTVWALYRDAIMGVRVFLRKRRTIRQSRRISTRQFENFLSRRFYDPGYLRSKVRTLFSRIRA